MSRTFIKRNSKTQKAARLSVDTIDLICYRAGITCDEWAAILFECGWQWAQRNVPHEKLRKAYLQDKSRGFWAWWVCEMIEDDKSLLDQNIPLKGGRYQEIKLESIYASSKNQNQA